MARSCPSFVRWVLVLAAVAAGGCDRNKPSSTTPEPADAPASDAVTLRYAVSPTPRALVQALELQLTDTRVGQYVEAQLQLHAALELVAEGEGVRTQWSVTEVEALELTGTVQPGEVERTRALLLAHGRGATVSDALGVADLQATEATAEERARRDAAGPSSPPSGVLLMTVLAEPLRLPRLPAQALRMGETVELAEESETVVTDAALVLPTTTVYRFTLRGIDEASASRVADVAIQIAWVAEPSDGSDGDGADVRPNVRLESRAEGTLLFDVDHGMPVSLELSRTDSFRVGEAEGERSLHVRSRYRIP